MHELSICQALLNQVTDIAAARSADRVTRITIEVGPLAGVDPALLVNAFAILRAGSCAAAATLAFEATAVEIVCLACGAQSRPRPNRLVCNRCGGFRTRLVAGDELRLRQVELCPPTLPIPPIPPIAANRPAAAAAATAA